MGREGKSTVELDYSYGKDGGSCEVHRTFRSDTVYLQTALSQVHNLHFVAYGHSIYVYTPVFPTQKIEKQPSLIFTSQPSSPGLTGYIDQRNPHSINNLVVAPFGTEEVIAAVRDDGDVDAFLTRHIVQAIERRSEPDSTIGIDGDEIRPFFQSNVGISAWGLAVHSEARILATSSNAHEVRVFKFGLLHVDDPESSSDEDAEDNFEALQKPGSSYERHRKTDVTHHVLNGDQNIPYISFCNTGDDPEARWLLTTDISGVCRVMNLHSLEAVQAFRFGRSSAAAHTGGFDRINAGWAIMFLDPRSFKPAYDAGSTLGVEVGVEKTAPKSHRNGEVWDLSNTARRLNEFAEPFMPHSQSERATGNSQQGRSESPLDESMEQNVDLDLSNSTEPANSSDDGGADVDSDIDMRHEDEDEDGGIEVQINESMDVDYDDDSEYETADENGNEEVSDGRSDSALSSEPETSERIGELRRRHLLDDDDDPEDEGTEDTISYTSWYSGESIVGNDPRFVHPLTPLCNGLPCPILHASVRNVYLLQPSKQTRSRHNSEEFNSTAAFRPPMVGFANPLKQPIHQSFGYLRIFERLNMNASIPSLGVIILASQKGRALILSLSKMTKSTAVPTSLEDFSCGDSSVYGMKIEAIVPFIEQERQNQRSSYPLHGIAVSPLQGSEGKKCGRWRLMLMYQDHSILSYELSRRVGARDSGIDIGNVVV